MLVEVIGFLAGIFTTLAALPQIIRTFKEKKVENISSYMFIALCIGVGLWTVYGIMKADWPIILTNGTSFILNGIMLFFKKKYSVKKKNFPS